MIPFMVADRPASLRILSGLVLPPQGVRLGLMTHANTTDRFASLFRDFPCGEPAYCEALYGKMRHPIGRCARGEQYASSFVKMGDSGVFTREGCQFSDYEALFQKYRKLDVDYGIIIDSLKDPKGTLESAKEAIDVYHQKERRPFRLVGVAQGNTVRQYVECYGAMKGLGYGHIAIGGLLRKKEKSKRFTHVRDEAMMYAVLRALRRRYPRDWLFSLGTYHPKRHNRLDALGIWGGDYKGWIFHYPEPKMERPRRWHDKGRYRAVRNYIEMDVIRRVTGELGNRNLLVLGCSRAKLSVAAPLPAIERYDGPAFQMVRKMFFDGLHLDVDLAVLSGKFGLLQPGDPIPDYDYRLPRGGSIPARAVNWRKALISSIERHRYREVLLAMGPDYVRALGDVHVAGQSTNIQETSGPIGMRLHQTKRWLVAKSNRTTPGHTPIRGALRALG